MKIKRLYAENLYSFENLEFEFDKYPGGTTLFLGRNLDQKTSNGAGKSSILKALYFAFYGEDVNGVVKAGVLRRNATTGYYVVVEFEDRGHSFKIERFEGRKDKSSAGKGLNFFIDGELFNGDGGVEETQKIINQKIKVTPRLFLSSIYSAQNSKNNFLVESDTDKKDLLSELLDLKIYSKAFEHIKKLIDETEKSIEEKQGKIANIKEQIASFEEQVKENLEKKIEFKQSLEKEIKEELSNYKKLSEELTALENKTELKFNLEKIKQQIIDYRKERDTKEIESSKESKVKVAMEKVQNQFSSIDESIQKMQLDNNKLNAEIKKLALITFDEAVLNQKIALKQNLTEKIERIASALKDLNELNLKINNLNNTINNGEKDISSLNEEKDKLLSSKDCPTCHREMEEQHLGHIKKIVDEISAKVAILESNNKIYVEEQAAFKIAQYALNLVVSEEKETQKSIKEIDAVILTLNIEKNNFDQAKNSIEEKNKQIATNDTSIQENQVKRSETLVKKEEIEKIDVIVTKAKTRVLELDAILVLLNADLIKAEIEFNQFSQLESSLNKLKEEKLKSETKIKELKVKPNPYEEMILSIERKTEVLLTKESDYLLKIRKEEDTLKYYKFWKVGFAPTGITSFITDDVIDLLNRKVQENLNDLFDGALSVFFDPESKNKKGVISNKISTHIFLNGKETAKESISGGELRRAILATELALTEIAESRSGNKFNVRFLDEPFDGMDSSGQLQAFKLFARLSKDKDGFFVISHDENFQNMCSNVVYILKKNETSKIVDKNAFSRSNIETDVPDDLPVDDTGVDDKKQKLAERLKKLAEKKDSN